MCSLFCIEACSGVTGFAQSALDKAQSIRNVTANMSRAAKDLVLETRVEYDLDDNRMTASFLNATLFLLWLPAFLTLSLYE